MEIIAKYVMTHAKYAEQTRILVRLVIMIIFSSLEYVKRKVFVLLVYHHANYVNLLEIFVPIVNF